MEPKVSVTIGGKRDPRTTDSMFPRHLMLFHSLLRRIDTWPRSGSKAVFRMRLTPEEYLQSRSGRLIGWLSSRQRTNEHRLTRSPTDSRRRKKTLLFPMYSITLTSITVSITLKRIQTADSKSQVQSKSKNNAQRSESSHNPYPQISPPLLHIYHFGRRRRGAIGRTSKLCSRRS
jgi:hypothetical protein